MKLLDFIEAIETALDLPARKNMMPMQAGDMARTWSDTSRLTELTGFRPSTSVKDGVARFVEWYRDYYDA